MLKRVKLQNFQSHKNSVVDFHEGVNTIIGTSDHGKSSIMRAIILATENKPTGSAFVSNWVLDAKGKQTEDTAVSIEFEDGGITRTRGAGSNTYNVTVGENTKEYTAFGASIVPEIFAFANLGDMNIQKQEDNFFLFGETSGEVMRRINSYTNLDLIDAVLSNAEKDMHSTRRKLKEVTTQLAELETKLQDFAVVPKMKIAYDSIIEKIKDYNSIVEQFDFIDQRVKRASVLQKELDDIGNINRMERKVNRIQESVASLSEHQKEFSMLQSLIKNVHQVETELSGDYLTSIARAVSTIEKIETISREYQEKMSVVQDVATLIQTHKKLTASVVNLATEIAELQDEYHEELGDVCPICGSPIRRNA